MITCAECGKPLPNANECVEVCGPCFVRMMEQENMEYRAPTTPRKQKPFTGHKSSARSGKGKIARMEAEGYGWR